jgi:hypothetical protein
VIDFLRRVAWLAQSHCKDQEETHNGHEKESSQEVDQESWQEIEQEVEQEESTEEEKVTEACTQ